MRARLRHAPPGREAIRADGKRDERKSRRRGETGGRETREGIGAKEWREARRGVIKGVGEGGRREEE